MLKRNYASACTIIAVLLSLACGDEGTEDTMPTWKSLGGPHGSGNAIISVAASAHEVYAGTEGGILFHLDRLTGTSRTAQWTQWEVFVYWSGAPHHRFFVGSSTGVHYIEEGDTLRTKATIGYPLFPPHVSCFASSADGGLTAGAEFGDESGGLYFSSDKGATWPVNVNNLYGVIDLTYESNGMLIAAIKSIFSEYGDVLAVTPSDSTQRSIKGDLVPDIYRAVCRLNGDIIFVGSDSNGVFRSASDSVWTPANSGLASLTVHDIAATSQGVLYAATAGGVFRSSNYGGYWVDVSDGLTDRSVLSLALDSNGHLFAGTERGGLFMTTTSR